MKVLYGYDFAAKATKHRLVTNQWFKSMLARTANQTNY